MNNYEIVNKTKEFIDDFMINLYFSNLSFYEGAQQSKIKSWRFKMNEAFHCKGLRSETDIEYYKKELKNAENDLFYNAAIDMMEIRKTSVTGIIYISNPSLTIGNEEFAKYLFESDMEDQRLLAFLDK
jgi:hypothetical protein